VVCVFSPDGFVTVESETMIVCAMIDAENKIKKSVINSFFTEKPPKYFCGSSPFRVDEFYLKISIILHKNHALLTFYLF
jgi:hypothetical protein